MRGLTRQEEEELVLDFNLYRLALKHKYNNK